MNKIIRLMRNIVHDFMLLILPKKLLTKLLSCEEVSKILTMEEKAKLRNHPRVRFHILICQCCTDYKYQLEIIEKSSQKLKEFHLSTQQKDLINKSKQNLISRFSKKN